MKSIITLLISIFVFQCTYAQKTPALRSETPVSKERVVNETYPKITLNENKCRFESLSIKPGEKGTYDLQISFARPCDKEEAILIPLSSLEDAVLVKDLVLNRKDYEYFHLFKNETGSASFEIVYSQEE